MVVKMTVLSLCTDTVCRNIHIRWLSTSLQKTYV